MVRQLNKVDLYLLSESGFASQNAFCCRLAEKAVAHGLTLHIQTMEAMQNEALNDALWSFKAESFLPHVVGQGRFMDFPITVDTVSVCANEDGHRDLLILLTTDLPANYQDFKRISLVVIQTEAHIQKARALYRQFKSEGIDVNIHDLRSPVKS